MNKMAAVVADTILKYILVNENLWISSEISLKCGLQGHGGAMS